MPKPDLDLARVTTKKDLQRLQASGVCNLYQLLTYLPFDLKLVKPLNFRNLNENDWFIAEVKLLDFQYKQGKNAFFTLSLQGSDARFLKVYWFVRGKWAFDFLRLNQWYQVLLSYKQPFYSLIKIALKKTEINQCYFELGKAALKTYLLPKYSKLGNLTSTDLQRIHQKIPISAYILNLNQLVPNSSIIPKVLNLAKIHKPENHTSFNQGMQDWTAFLAFLKMVLIQSVDLEKSEEYGFKSSLDKSFLQKLSTSLKFSLSNSQKLAIWEILKEV